MNQARGGGYGQVQMTLASAECLDQPVCALVVAAYRVTSWQDGSEPAPPPAGSENELVPTPPAASPTPGSGPGGTHTRVAEEWIAHDHDAPVAEAGSAAQANGKAPTSKSASPARESAVARVSVEKEVDYATAKRYYKLYVATFGALDTEAAGRQLLSEDEFREEMVNPRVHKYIAWDADDQAIGMSTLATDVATMPWVSPTYFAHRYPEHHARDAIFYLGFTLVHPRHRGTGVFQLMIDQVIRYVIEQRGVVAWDTCQANDERGMNNTAFRTLEELGEVTTEIIDRQIYYAAVLHGPRESPAP
jgi:GNAT superfamily N-acetyltransferase